MTLRKALRETGAALRAGNRHAIHADLDGSFKITNSAARTTIVRLARLRRLSPEDVICNALTLYAALSREEAAGSTVFLQPAPGSPCGTEDQELDLRDLEGRRG